MKGIISQIEKVTDALRASEICKHHALETNYFLQPEKKSFCGTCAAIVDTDVLLKDITIEQEMDDDEDPMYFLDVEAESFVLDAKAFFKKNIKIGDKVSFIGKIVLYKDPDGAMDFEIADAEKVKIIEDYPIPAKPEDFIFYDTLCEKCQYAKDCDGTDCLARE